MARPWPTDEVEAILKARRARKADVPNGPHDAFVTRGEPIHYLSGGHEVDVHWSTEVFVGGRWQSLLEIIHEDIAELRRRQHR